MVSALAIHEASARIAPHIQRTPMLGSTSLSRMLGVGLAFKAELLQKTGSFKARGALQKIASLSATERSRGLVTISAGNHAAALAYAAATAGIACTVVMPADANRAKVRATEAYGARVVLHGDVHQAFVRCRELESEHGLTFAHPFDDPEIIAGAGSVGLECLEQQPDLDCVVVPVGGGGLIAGVSTAIKNASRRTKIYGVEPEGAAAMWQSLQEHKPAHLERIDTIADGLAPPMAGELNYAIVCKYVDDVVKVSDAKILEAMRLLMTRCKLVVEPAGAAGLAAVLSNAIPTSTHEKIVVILSGGNVDLQQLKSLL